MLISATASHNFYPIDGGLSRNDGAYLELNVLWNSRERYIGYARNSAAPDETQENVGTC